MNLETGRSEFVHVPKVTSRFILSCYQRRQKQERMERSLSASAFPRRYDRDRNQHPCNHDNDLITQVMISADDHDAQVQYFSGPVFSQMVPMMLKVLKFFGGSPQSR